MRELSPAGELVFGTLLTGGPLYRAEVAARTGLSSAAVTKVTRPLIEGGYLREDDLESDGGRIGRPGTPLRVCADRACFLGVKVTADMVFAVVTDLLGSIRAVRHRPLPGTGVTEVVASIAPLVADLVGALPGSRDRIGRLGVTVGGEVDAAAGVVRSSPFLGWEAVPLAELVAAATGLPTVVDNDVRALTVAEQWFGAGVGARTFALVTIGAGVGSGIVVDGTLLTGANGVAGKIGHLPVSDGPPCGCGGSGCVQAIAATPAICLRLGVRSLDQAIDLAARDRPAAREVFADAGRAVGRALAALANLVGPERIILSGEGVAAYRFLEPTLRAAFAAQAYGAAAECELVVRALSFDEWARGAAAVGVHRFIGAGLR